MDAELAEHLINLERVPEDLAMGLELEAIDIERELMQAEGHGRISDAIELRGELAQVHEDLVSVAEVTVEPTDPARIAAPRAGEVAA
jgi:hypothetical protein